LDYRSGTRQAKPEAAARHLLPAAGHTDFTIFVLF